MKRGALLLLVILAAGAATAQEETVDPNRYYAYPFSFGAGYRTVTPFASFASDFAVQELEATFRAPLTESPVWNGVAKLGLLQYDSQDEALPDKWDHYHVYGVPGIGYSQRLSKEFELGAALTAGITQSVFPNALEEPVGARNFIASLDGKLTLNPSYNVSIDVSPALRYLRSFSPFREYDGLSFGIGVAAHYRLGRDPDSAESLIRAIRFGEVEMPDAFAAMQSYYVDNAIGRVSLTNAENYDLADVQVSFHQEGFMDSPTPAARIGTLAAGQSVEVDLLASYNSEVFSTEGVTPLTGEVIVTYTARGRPAEQRESVTYDLHDKTALTWDDDRKMGSFITPADSAVRNYTSFIRQVGLEDMVDSASEPLQVAMLAYHALAELGVIYQIDPTSPFTQVQDNVTAVDSVNLPRDTLTRLAGDCDDLTALYATMLETVGIETAFITTPGHIYVAFNTGVPARDYLIVHPNREMLIVIDDRVWVPVEITMLGSGGFMDAWRFGVDEWRRYADETSRRGLYRTSEAQTVYRPVGLRQTDLGLQYGSADRIRGQFRDEFDRLADTIISDVRESAEERGTKGQYNKLGIYAARLGRYDAARDAFRRAADMDATYLDPRINLGSVNYLQGRYAAAVRAYEGAVRALELSGRALPDIQTTLYINLSKAHFELANYDDAESFYELAAAVDPEGASAFSYLAQAGSDGTRASAAQSGPPILFADQSGEE